MIIEIKKDKNAAAIMKEMFRRNRKSSLAVLSGALMKIEKSGISFVMTDLTNCVTVRFNAESNWITQEITISGSALSFIAENIGTSNLLISEPEKIGGNFEIAIKCEKSGRSVFMSEIRDFPYVPELPAKSKMEEWMTSRSDLEYVMAAVSKNETRPHINGILFDGKNIVSTDGHRLHLVAVKNNAIGVVRRSGIDLLLKIKKADLMCGEIEGSAVFTAESENGFIAIISKKIEAEFPPYDQVIPKTGRRMEFKGIRVMADQVSQIAKRIKNRGGIEISSEGWIFSDPKTQETIGGEMETFEFTAGFKIGVNAGYFADSLIGSEYGNALVDGPLDPILVICGNRKSVVMPMRV